MKIIIEEKDKKFFDKAKNFAGKFVKIEFEKLEEQGGK